jgi:hypothetical protein
MQVAVWDTYVTKKDGAVMHFDIIAPTTIKDAETIYQFGKSYLNQKNQEGQILSSKECRFCHIEQASPEMLVSIDQTGFYIIEMQGCD